MAKDSSFDVVSEYDVSEIIIVCNNTAKTNNDLDLESNMMFK